MTPGGSRRAYLRTLAGTVVGASLAGCTRTDRRTVEMTDSLTFAPVTIDVTVGETVTWRNVGSAAHSVTAYEDRLPASAAFFASGGFDAEPTARNAYPGGAIDGGGTYEHAFDVSGNHPYFCIPHERAGMTGTVVVHER